LITEALGVQVSDQTGFDFVANYSHNTRAL
jgi:hypothetical protein